MKIKERNRIIINVLLIILFLIIIGFSVWIGACVGKAIIKQNQLKQQGIEYYQEIQYEEIQKYLSELKEKDNEIALLKDRILFLSFMPSIIEHEPFNEEVEKENNQNEIEESVIFEYTSMLPLGEFAPLPKDIDTNTFRCMDYHTITDKNSWQYQIQLLSKTDTNGLRYYEYNNEKYYTVALATAYGIDLGNAYKVTLENGTSFNIIHAEYKHDIRYISADDFGDADKNYDQEDTISVIEFIYDWANAPMGLINDGEANRYLGDNCYIYGDGCNIKSMEYLGKIWTANNN